MEGHDLGAKGGGVVANGDFVGATGTTVGASRASKGATGALVGATGTLVGAIGAMGCREGATDGFAEGAVLTEGCSERVLGGDVVRGTNVEGEGRSWRQTAHGGSNS